MSNYNLDKEQARLLLNEKERKIPVLEIFGPTIQGEGALCGRKTMFVRTAGCDYRCNWCDSAFTWDDSVKKNVQMLSAQEIWKQLLELGQNCFDHVTISGGNPALLSSVGTLVSLLKEKGMAIALETQGSKWQSWMMEIDDVTLSPKPPSSGMSTNFEVLDFIIEKLKNVSNISLKIVVFHEEDFEYAIRVHERYKAVPFFLQVGNEDVSTLDQEILTKKLLQKFEWLIQKTVESPKMNDVKVLPQLHSLVWGNKRGV